MGIAACRPVNDVGKPCAGEPHARFDRGGGAGKVGRLDGGCWSQVGDGKNTIKYLNETSTVQAEPSEPAPYHTHGIRVLEDSSVRVMHGHRRTNQRRRLRDDAAIFIVHGRPGRAMDGL
jgi:hypothetical protein